MALSAGAGQTVERETAPLEPPSREESGVETDPPGGQPPDESAALRPARVVRSGVLVGLPVVVVAFAAVARRRRRAVAARGAATVTLALWTPLFAASVGPLFLLAAALSGVATGLAVADRRPDGAARPG